MFGLVLIMPVLASFHMPKKSAFALSKVVIDAGHGGHDPGCLGKHSKEKDIALGIALKLGAQIEKEYPDVKVIYTRKTDKFLELHERANIANSEKADLFICIHANSACYFDKKRKKELCNDETQGVESWVMGLHKSEENLEVAKRENEVVLLEKDYTQQYDGFDPNSPEANIIFSLYQNAFIDQSLRFASMIQQEMKVAGRPGRGVKQAGFLVLFKTSMPSVLIETGFLSNPKEEKYLASEKGQDEMSEAIFRAFTAYRNSVRHETAVRGKDEDKPKPKQEESKPAADDKKPAPVPEKPAPSGGTEMEKQPEKEEEKVAVKPPVKTPVTKPSEESSIVYSIQFLASPNQLRKDNPKFRNITGVNEYHEKGYYKYYTGSAKTFEEAVMLQKRVRGKGFSDAFIIAWDKDRKISVKDARAKQQKK